MSARRFLATFAFSALVAATLTVGVNALIDPLGVVPGSPSLPGLNAEKVLRFNNDRIYKPLDLLGARPVTVVLGTSRVLQAFDPTTLSGTPHGPAYNYGLAGGNLDELEAHFEKFIAATPSVKYVFVELFPPRFGERSERAVPGRSELLASTFLSWSALQQSAQTVWHNRRPLAGRTVVGPTILADGRQSFVQIAPLGTFLAYASALMRARPRFEAPEWTFESMRRMRQTAHRRGITLTFFVSPMHAVQLYGLHVTGQWPALEAWKRSLARESDVRDFSMYSSATEEPARNEMVYWSDPHHFSRLTATEVVAHLAGREANGPSGFGVRLVPDRVEDDLHGWRQARDRWIARNPEWVELFQLAREAKHTDLPAMRRVPGSEECPVRVAGTLLSRLAQPHPSHMWIPMSSRTSLDPPIMVRVRSSRSAGHGVDEACELTIDAAPATPSVGLVDWRIGHPIGSLIGSTAGTVRYTIRVRATAPTTLSTGSVYVYDGIRTSEAPVTGLTRDWRLFTVDHTLSPGASRLEVWFRLVAGHGTVRPLGERIYFDASVALVD